MWYHLSVIKSTIYIYIVNWFETVNANIIRWNHRRPRGQYNATQRFVGVERRLSQPTLHRIEWIIARAAKDVDWDPPTSPPTVTAAWGSRRLRTCLEQKSFKTMVFPNTVFYIMTQIPWFFFTVFYGNWCLFVWFQSLGIQHSTLSFLQYINQNWGNPRKTEG